MNTIQPDGLSLDDEIELEKSIATEVASYYIDGDAKEYLKVASGIRIMLQQRGFLKREHPVGCDCPCHKSRIICNDCCLGQPERESGSLSVKDLERAYDAGWEDNESGNGHDSERYLKDNNLCGKSWGKPIDIEDALEIKRVTTPVDWKCNKCGSVEWDVSDVDCRNCRMAPAGQS